MATMGFRYFSVTFALLQKIRLTIRGPLLRLGLNNAPKLRHIYRLREEIFAGRKSREFLDCGPNLRNEIPLLTPKNVNSRKLIPPKFSKLEICEN